MLWLLNHYGRIVVRIKRGFWCTHLVWSQWYLVDGGREKHRYCKTCGWMETTR